MIVTTTPGIEGKQLTQYLGVVTAQTFIGASFFKDLVAGLRDLFVRRPGTYEKVLEEAKQYAIHDLIQKAKSMGANAIVGFRIDYVTVGNNGNMLMIHASGTAVKLT